jgi:hypothetical protein
MCDAPAALPMPIAVQKSSQLHSSPVQLSYQIWHKRDLARESAVYIIARFYCALFAARHYNQRKKRIMKLDVLFIENTYILKYVAVRVSSSIFYPQTIIRLFCEIKRYSILIMM